MLNHFDFIGRLTKDPELRYTQNKKAVASMRVAIDRDGEGTDFVNLTAWGKTAEFCDQYFHKGNLIVGMGRLTTNEWTDKDGKRRSDVEVTLDRVWFGEPKKKGFEEIETADADLPF